VPVDYAPATVTTAATGTIRITAPNASPPASSIALTASSTAACFEVEPTSFDFGEVGFSPTQLQICAPNGAEFAGLNACDEPIIVSEIDVLDRGDADAGPQFAIGSSPVLPATVSPGAQLAFQIGFTPSSFGGKAMSSPSPPGAQTSSQFIPLTGDAVSTGQRTNTFIAPPLSKAARSLVDSRQRRRRGSDAARGSGCCHRCSKC